MGKKIVMITSGWKMSGVYRVESELIDEWRRQGHNVSILNANGRIMSDALQKMTVEELEEEPSVKIIAIVHRFIRLRQFFKHHREDTIVALSITADIFAALFGLTLKNKIVISERNDPGQYPKSKLYSKFRDLCFELADVCVFQTCDAMKHFSKRVQRRGVIIPNPINGKIPEYPLDRNTEKTVMSTGRLKEQKNFPMLIKAFAKFNEQYPEYTLELYGDGPLKDELLQLSSELGIQERVLFNDFCDDIFPIMARTSMFVMSSNYEGISNSMLEALAIGIPTICTDCPVGGAREMIENGVNGLLVPVGDVDALSKAMCRIAGDDEFARRLAKNAHEIRVKYPAEAIASRWTDIM